ncbi:MAG TPA: lipopolysaccharide heptosyltransferase II [candidate division Zixibacteria bacterium]|nr:lipopolysaccharide heptosyltransferase II [candidate division Zixibacteria bacterium]HEQ99601.1 lipopolysaccharide heptosyltransferase II [candidate division Zixibacteria bacterium]
MTNSKMKKVIIRFPNWLGDCIMAAPVLTALRNAHPEWEVTLLVRGYLSQLFRSDPRVDHVIELKDKSDSFNPTGFFELADELGQAGYDTGIILPDSFSSALIFFMAKIPTRIGYKAQMRRFMLTDALDQPKKIIHRSQKYLRLLKSVDVIPHVDVEPEIFPDDESRQRAELLARGLDRYIVITPQTNAPSRRWGYDKYSKLIARVVKALKLQVVLLGAENEYDVVEKVGSDSGVQFLNLAGRASLPVSYGIMKEALCFVGNDSGAAHLAAAAGTYTISISGADNPEETRPLAARGKIIRSDLPCISCVKNICPRKDVPMECMHVISVEEVFEAVRETVDE